MSEPEVAGGTPREEPADGTPRKKARSGEAAGALKNVMALAAGISDGLGLGANARASLLCRGLAEIGLVLGQTATAEILKVIAGAPAWQVFFCAFAAGGLMAFTLSWDELIVTFFTADAASATLPLRIFGLAKVGLNPMINALSALFVLATVAFVLFSARLRRDANCDPLSP